MLIFTPQESPERTGERGCDRELSMLWGVQVRMEGVFSCPHSFTFSSRIPLPASPEPPDAGGRFLNIEIAIPGNCSREELPVGLRIRQWPSQQEPSLPSEEVAEESIFEALGIYGVPPENRDPRRVPFETCQSHRSRV